MAALTMSDLKSYVRGAPRQVAIGTVLLDITHNLLQSRFVEIAFDITNSVADIKAKIYGMTGSSEEHMRLFLNGQVELRESDNKLLGEYGAKSGDYLRVVDEDPFSTARGGALDDVSQVTKFELTEEEYDKRDNTYRAYKRRMLAADPNWKSIYQINSEKRLAAQREARRAAGYPDEKYEHPDAIRERIQVGQRCIVNPGARRGTVAYVGPVPELPNYEVINDGSMPVPAAEGESGEQAEDEEAAAAPASAPTDAAADGGDPLAGAPETAANNDPAARPTIPLVGECLWVGVALDEPVGKHDGVAKGGKRYFQCGYQCGVFARPGSVQTGDYPEVDPFASDEEEEEQENEVDINEEL